MASNIGDSDSDMKQSLLICKHCNNAIKDPKSLPCLHAYCTTCLQTLALRKETFNCPQCAAVTKIPAGGATSFPVASHLIALAEYVQLYIQNNPSIPCFNKINEDGHQDAAVKCMECDVYYCNTCDPVHKMSKLTQHHTTIKLTDFKEEHFEKTVQRKVSSCEKHPDSPIEYLCLDEACNTFICLRCNIGLHKTHQCVEVEENAKEYRANHAKVILEDMAQKQALLNKLQSKIKAALQKNDKDHENNVKAIKERTKEIHKMVDEQEKVLLEKENKDTDDIKHSYTEVMKNVNVKSNSLTYSKAVIQNLSRFSPDDELLKIHEEIQKKIETALFESSTPELWQQSVSVTPQGQPLVERKQEVRKTKAMRCQDALDKAVDSLAVFENLIIALKWHTDGSPTTVFVRGHDEAKAKAVKERIEKHCPHAYRVVPMVKDGKEKIVICNIKGNVSYDIKVLSLECDDVEDLGLDARHKPLAITLDDKYNVLYTNNSKPKAIRKKTGHQTETIFTNQAGNDVLDDPWYITTNINGDIVVCDSGKKSLFIFNEKGELLNTYKDFTPGDGLYPNGVCTCPKGLVYVSDGYGNCIHRLDKTGTFKDYVVTKEDGLSYPTALQWYNDMLVVGQSSGQIKFFKV